MRLVALVCALAALPAAAQTAPTPGSCTLGKATAVIDAGDVAARVFNTGSLFYGNGYVAAYSVPQRDGKVPIYTAGLWMAAKIGGEVRAGGGTYGAPSGDFTFWPGPLGPDARPVDPADCAPFDRIYTVARADVADYYRTGIPTDDLRDWPYQLGAPVLDGDGVAGNYNLAGGDQPAITGTQTAWWLMNDAGGPHTRMATLPLGVEVRVAAATFPTATVLGQTTLYRYTITNRTQATIDSAYVGLFSDVDLGDGGDDLVGSDTTGSMAYVYNSDNQDGTGTGASYGLNPPAVGLQVVSGPVGLPNGRDDDHDGQVDEPGERLLMTAAPLLCKSQAVCYEPQSGRAMFYKLQGLLNDGAPVRAFGDGVYETQGAPTRFYFHGDPVTGVGWSARNPGPGQTPFQGQDSRTVVSTGPFRLAPGASETVVFAVPFARGASNLDSVSRLRGIAGGLLDVFAAGQLEPRRVERPPLPPVDEAVRISRPAPNPFRERAAVRYEMPAGTRMRATLTDARGRRIAVLFDGPTEAPSGVLEIDGAGLAPGVYRVRVVVGAGERLLTLVRVR